MKVMTVGMQINVTRIKLISVGFEPHEQHSMMLAGSVCLGPKILHSEQGTAEFEHFIRLMWTIFYRQGQWRLWWRGVISIAAKWIIHQSLVQPIYCCMLVTLSWCVPTQKEALNYFCLHRIWRTSKPLWHRRVISISSWFLRYYAQTTLLNRQSF